MRIEAATASTAFFGPRRALSLKQLPVCGELLILPESAIRHTQVVQAWLFRTEFSFERPLTGGPRRVLLCRPVTGASARLWRICLFRQKPTFERSSLVNPSLTAKVRFHARNVHLDRPSAGDPGKACQAGRSSGSGGRITRGQTPVAHHEARAAPCSESDLMGSADAGSLCAFRVTRTLEQDGRDTEAFHASVAFTKPW